MPQDISTGAIVTRIRNLWTQQKKVEKPGERRSWSLFLLTTTKYSKFKVPDSLQGKQEKQTRDKHEHNKRTTENTTGVPRTIGAKISKS